MIDKIDTILYLPTLRCNLNCKHCGENQDIGKNQEVDGDFILGRLRESLLIRTKLITVTGGEPFLNPSFSQFVLHALRETDYEIDITSNGYLYDVIEELAENISEENKNRLQFHISIDGIEKTHDAIRRCSGSYTRAIKAVSCLRTHRIPCGINSVVQESNLRELELMKQTFTSKFPGIDWRFGPVSADASEDHDYIFTDEYQEAIWRYLDPLGKRRVLSRGRFGITHCTAGTTSIVIGPDGKVYPCLTGAYYRGRESREKFFLGDLRTDSLDEILTSERSETVRSDVVQRCSGCSVPCEVTRESNSPDMNYALHKDELPRAFILEEIVNGPNSQMLGDGLLDYDGWHGLEWDNNDAGDTRRWCWSGGKQGRICSRIFIKVPFDEKRIIVTFSKITRNLKVKLLLNGREVWSDMNSGESWRTVELNAEDAGPYATLTFLLDRLYRPSELFDSEDDRRLGVCVHNIKLCK